MKTVIILIASLVVATLIIPASVAFADPISIPYVDEFNLPAGPTWVVKTVWPSGIEDFKGDPGGPIFVTSPEIVAGLFDGTSPQDWRLQKEGSSTIAVFHSGTPKTLVPKFGRLQISVDKEITAGQPAFVSDATWRFRESSTGPTPQPDKLTSCPTNQTQASLMGGLAQNWSEESGGTGWHFEGDNSLLTAPSFGRIDIDGGTLRNGQSATVSIATFWCRG